MTVNLAAHSVHCRAPLKIRVWVEVFYDTLQEAVRVAVLGVVDLAIAVLVFADRTTLVSHADRSRMVNVPVCNVEVLDHHHPRELL
jgi:hypothetical protein